MSASKFLRPINSSFKICRYCSDENSSECAKRGLILGAFETGAGAYALSSSGAKYDSNTNGMITNLLSSTGGVKLGKARIFHNVPGEFYAIAVVGAGQQGLTFNKEETLNEAKENIRIAAGVGAQVLQEHGVDEIHVEGFDDPEPAAEGSSLGVWRFEEFKNPMFRRSETKVQLYDDPNMEAWYCGIVKGEAQNTARKLEEMPPNKMTPSKFAEVRLGATKDYLKIILQQAIHVLCPKGIEVEIRDRDWMEMKGFKSFLNMCRGTCEAPLLVEMTYNGGSDDSQPVALAGKGVTFDSGGICLRKCKGMSEFRADLAGGAVVIGVLKAIASLKLPINVKALIPLCENMPGGSANKPGDLFITMNNKSITMLDTSKEGRVSLADSLEYTASYKPCLVMTVATLTEGIRVALGGAASGVFTNSDIVWKELEIAGAESGDRVWRMPFWKYYSQKVTSHPAFDVKNVGDGRGGTPSIGAMFLYQFLPMVDFAHFDITGTGMISSGVGYPYLKKGLMTGRPVRTITQFLLQVAYPEKAGVTNL